MVSQNIARAMHMLRCVYEIFFAGFGCDGGVGFFGLWVEPLSFPCCLLLFGVVVVFSCLCVRFFSVSPFLVFCILVVVKFCLAASRLYCNCFLFNKKHAQAWLRKRNIYLRYLSNKVLAFLDDPPYPSAGCYWHQ